MHENSLISDIHWYPIFPRSVKCCGPGQIFIGVALRIHRLPLSEELDVKIGGKDWQPGCCCQHLFFCIFLRSIVVKWWASLFCPACLVSQPWSTIKYNQILLFAANQRTYANWRSLKYELLVDLVDTTLAFQPTAASAPDLMCWQHSRSTTGLKLGRSPLRSSQMLQHVTPPNLTGIPAQQSSLGRDMRQLFDFDYLRTPSQNANLRSLWRLLMQGTRRVDGRGLWRLANAKATQLGAGAVMVAVKRNFICFWKPFQQRDAELEANPKCNDPWSIDVDKIQKVDAFSCWSCTCWSSLSAFHCSAWHHPTWSPSFCFMSEVV